MDPGASERLAEAARLRFKAKDLEPQARLEGLRLWNGIKLKETKKGKIKAMNTGMRPGGRGLR